MPWESQPAQSEPVLASPPLWEGFKRGAMGLCPVCGQGKLFQGYLRLADECTHCHTELGRIRADDAPPYFTILIVGHVLVPFVFMAERAWHPPMWVHMAIWPALFAALSAVMLRPVKGMTVAWMLRLGLTGTEQGEQTAVLPPRRRPGDA